MKYRIIESEPGRYKLQYKWWILPWSDLLIHPIEGLAFSCNSIEKQMAGAKALCIGFPEACALQYRSDGSHTDLFLSSEILFYVF